MINWLAVTYFTITETNNLDRDYLNLDAHRVEEREIEVFSRETIIFWSVRIQSSPHPVMLLCIPLSKYPDFNIMSKHDIRKCKVTLKFILSCMM